jgi:poly(A) polymerase
MISVRETVWFKSSATQNIIQMFESSDCEAFFVGGCVRNSLMNLPATDIDMATPLLPDDVMRLAKIAGLKVIPTGVAHGTVTVVSNKVPFEITTFRRDVSTDGRRATVAYSKSLEQDASRRDFSMNALYASLDGDIIDPLCGLTDLKAREVRFIGNPVDRIKEDYLRILRFFRFFATYGDHTAGLDSSALAACAQNLEGLKALSGERVGAEILKLLEASDPCSAIGAMEAAGVLNVVLPGATGRTLYPFVTLEFVADPIARLAALGCEDADVRLKLSKKQALKLRLFKSSIGDGRSLDEISNVDGADVALTIAALRAAIFETHLPADLESQILFAAQQSFPIEARDLMPNFVGKELGLALKKLHRAWLQSGFALTKSELLEKLETK